MDQILRDVRFGIRVLRKSPGFTAMALIALALGIGANSAIFSVVNAVLLRPLPFNEPSNLVWLWDTQPQLEKAPASLPDVIDWKNQNESFDSVAAFIGAGAFLDRSEEAEVIVGAMVDADFFRVLRVNPSMGRVFTSEENKPNAPRVAILSDKLWKRRFGADPNIIGQPVTLTGASYTVIGVMPEGFDYPGKSELWRPLAMDNSKNDRGPHYLSVIGRLKPTTTLTSAQTEMSAIAARLAEAFPEKITGHGVKLQSLHEVEIGNVKPALFVLCGAVGFVLLIACANVANLLLARSAARRKEFAIRLALGAKRSRIIAQLLTESMLLSLAGGAAGVLLAYWGVKALIAISPGDIPRTDQIGLDRWVVGFTLAVSLVTGLLFGLAPAVQSSKSDLNDALKDAGRTTPGRRSNRIRAVLVASEIALALVLLVGAGLMIRSFERLNNVNPGLRTKNVMSLAVALLRAKYPDDQQVSAFFRDLPGRVARVPGVVSASIVGDLPLTGLTTSDYMAVEGRPEPPPNERPPIYYRVCSPDYFHTFDIPMLAGRDFNEQDTKQSPNVAVVNASVVRMFFADENPLGKRFKLQGQERDPLTIIGIVSDARENGIESEPVPEIYVPFLQDPLSHSPSRSMFVVVNTSSDSSMMVGALRETILEADKSLPIYNVKSMDNYVYESLASRRFNLLLLEIFAGVALALAAVGIYGVVSYFVSQRTHEIGLRLALGAARADVLKMVIRQALALILSGVAVGLFASFVLTRFVTALLYEISPTDPLTFVLIPLILTMAALAASLAPALRATRVDPMVALRYE